MCVLPVFRSRAAGGGVDRSVGALEAPRSSETWFGDGLTFGLLLHLLPLLACQQEVQMLSGDISTMEVRGDTKIFRNLTGNIQHGENNAFQIPKIEKDLCGHTVHHPFTIEGPVCRI